MEQLKRFILLDENNKVIAIRYGPEIVEGEIESETGEIGQIRQEDGTFINPPPEEPDEQVSLSERIYAEILYQTALLELQMLGGD